ncbi:MAG: CoA-binding protein [Symbiobacteriaceae bacterium]|nr:CoA-binding protein [Symbiobacteriaceae bacterium]
MSVLDALFQPTGVAVLGASNNPDKAGYYVVKNLRDMGYPGEIYPVNLRESQIQGLASYPNLVAIPGMCQLLVLIMPAEAIYSVMADLAARMEQQGDIKVIVCAASGFAELENEEGFRRQECLLETARHWGIRVVGPNCIGVIDQENKVNTTFVDNGLPLHAPTGEQAPGVPSTQELRPLGISLVSQSGSVAAMLLMLTASLPQPVMLRKFCSIGNMADVDFIDILEHYEQDEGTKVIGIYLEGYSQGRKLAETLGRITVTKPVVVLKVGRSEAGAKAAASHTGSLAGSYAVYEAALRQKGATLVHSMRELVYTLLAFACLPLPPGRNSFIMTQTGGMGIFATDETGKYPQINLANLTSEGEARLRSAMPPMATWGRAVGYADISVAASVKQHAAAVEIALNDAAIDNLVFLTVLPSFISQEELGIAWAHLLAPAHPSGKPVYMVILAGGYVKQVRRFLESQGLLTFEMPEDAVTALAHMLGYAEYRRGL